ncbi:hypothetical protein P7H16_19550 [Paenibacillus larvae]|nr:hypothetical protein [Paenibacillus larvae]MDT2237580.1 hypothetical protein [Paenibacillus larvae]MDT2248660.1 hypothetical protein [Paenibacillus larvae]MDT2260476.1 hypothetical protein [Paenibacillus larvae]MDT2265510.1 hypothetical protein [Paenibacillus larvae]MDT2276005.1 hypothetical protein [Paenibacillus larvae]
MREIGVTYVKGDEWKRKQIQMLISSDQAPVSPSTTKIGKKEETYPESAVLDEFWTTLLRMARVAKKEENVWMFFPLLILIAKSVLEANGMDQEQDSFWKVYTYRVQDN